MKKTKIIFLLSAIIMLCFLLTACDSKTPATPSATPGQSSTAIPAISQEYDTAKIWDGSVADSFSKGDGGETSPFEISSPEELAYLAKEVNAGNEYTGKYFSLVCDIDLDNHEWTPIGNGEHSFAGIFDGKDHTVENLKVLNGANYIDTTIGKEMDQFVIGFFGSCSDAIIKDLCIDKAYIAPGNITDANIVDIGVLTGHFYIDKSAEISGVKILNATVESQKFVPEKPVYIELSIGAMSGLIKADSESSFTMSEVESDLQVILKNDCGSNNFIGATAGVVVAGNQLNIVDCASYLSLEINPDFCYTLHNYFGGFGVLDGYSNRALKLTNIFSKVTIDKICDSFYGYQAYRAYAISGYPKCFGYREGGKYELTNVFGYIEQIDKESGKREISTLLYDPDDKALSYYSIENCQGCEKLPENHGFDEKIWDLSDLSRPVLK